MTVWVPEWHPGPDATSEALAGIVRWTSADALWSLAAEFGVTRPAVRATGETLEWLDAFSGAHWDFRGGNERNLAASADLSDAQQAAALELGPRLGLTPSRPRAALYDAVIMTGGMVRAGIVKPRFVRALLDAGLTTSSLVFLGAHRPFAGDEVRLAAALGVPGDDEVDAMVHGMRSTFGIATPHESAGGDGHARWRRASWPAVGGVGYSVVAAPSSAPDERRANTADTFRHWAAGAADGIRSVLVVTTPIYVPYQAAAAVETLGIVYGMAVETVGVDAAANDLGEHTQRFLPQHILQELRSAIRGIRSLHTRLIALP